MTNDVHALSGAYAVDALDDIERAAFERHLDECPECQDEVASLREASSLLAGTVETAPPPALRDRVLAQVATTRPLPPQVGATPAEHRQKRRPRRRFAVLVAAAAAVAVVGAGVVVTQEPWADETSQVPSATDAVLQAEDARSSSVDFKGGATATVTHSDSVGEAVLVTSEMPPPPDGMVYQLWLEQPGVGMVSAGVMPTKADQTVLLDGDAATATAAGITVEPDGGSTAPTTDPIALFDFGEKA